MSWGLQKVHSNAVTTVCAVLKLTRGYTTKVLPRVSKRCVQALPTQWYRTPWLFNHAWWGRFAMLMFISAPVHTIHCIACIFQSYNVHIRGLLYEMNPSTCARSSKAIHLFLQTCVVVCTEICLLSLYVSVPENILSILTYVFLSTTTKFH